MYLARLLPFDAIRREQEMNIEHVRFGSAIPKGPPFWKPSFMVVAGNSSWYYHNQTTDPNPNTNRIPNRKLSRLEMAENGGHSEWRPDTACQFFVVVVS